jgi:hypothetical protein
MQSSIWPSGLTRRRYNGMVPGAAAKRQPKKKSPPGHLVPELYTLETTGLLVIAALIFVLTLVHYWHPIAGSVR